MEYPNALLEQRGLPPVANQNQREMPPMANQDQLGDEIEAKCTLRDYIMPRVEQNMLSIRRPTIAANSFKIKASVIQMIATTCQFNGLPNDDPNMHLQTFGKICDTFKYNGIPKDFIKLKLFPFSLRNNAKAWLNSLPPNLIISFNQLAQAFLNRYFPPGKPAHFRNEITSFAQFENESLCKT
ncbi:hypothetical protein LWI29_025065 [Acer saccharum]|uniref:Retrotransposon gag domain-containing protein n=1 Tax=Acer saccharum TaxID=4024 RepID=A0AA39VWD2_ACESA|nr:hypothetical protein LWI29_025065 [Acer saccharum]